MGAGKRIFDLGAKLASAITTLWELEIDIFGESESSRITIGELITLIFPSGEKAGYILSTDGAGTFSWIGPEKDRNLTFSSGIITTKETRFAENTLINSIDFDIAEIDSIVYSTRVPGGTTYTARADLAAINTYAATAGDFYLKIVATFDVLYFGSSDIVVKSQKYQA